MNSPSIKKIMNPADKVTTEYLQRARRYAQRKRLPRISHATSRNMGQHSAQNSEDSQPSSSKNDNATTNDIPELMAPFQPPGYPPLGRVCCAGYSAVRISDLLRQLPPSVHEYAAQIGPISFDGAAFSPSVGLQSNQVATKTLHRSIDSAYARRLLDNPSLAHITVTLDLATQIKKSVKANGPMEALLAQPLPGHRAHKPKHTAKRSRPLARANRDGPARPRAQAGVERVASRPCSGPVGRRRLAVGAWPCMLPPDMRPPSAAARNTGYQARTPGSRSGRHGGLGARIRSAGCDAINRWRCRGLIAPYETLMRFPGLVAPCCTSLRSIALYCTYCTFCALLRLTFLCYIGSLRG